MTTAHLHRSTSGRRWLVPVVALTLIATQVGLRGWWVSRAWFLVDDYRFLSDLARGQDDLDWYLRIHQGHFMPLSFGLVKLVHAVGEPFEWTGVAVEIVALQALASLACWWMLQSLFGARRAILVPLAFYLFAPLTMPSIMWWAVAINQLPHQVAFFLAIGAHVRWCRTRRRGWLLLALLAVALGYSSYAKAALIVVSLGLLTWVWFSWGRPWPRFWRVVRTYRAVWIGYGVLSVAWLYVYLDRSPEAPAQPAASGLLGLTQASLLRTFAPALTGGPWEWDLFGLGPISYTATPLVGSVAAALVVAAVVAHAGATRERALRPLWPVAVYLAGSIALVYGGRAYVLVLLGGDRVGTHLQYLSDIAPLLVACAAAMYLPVVGASEPVRPRDEPLWRGRLHPTVPATLGAAILVGSIWSSHQYARPYADFPERTLTQRAIASIQERQPRLADVPVPATVMSLLMGEHALIKNYFAPLGDVVDVHESGTDLWMFDDEATLRRVGVRDPETTENVADPAPDGRCRRVGAGGLELEVPIPPSLGLWLAVDYRVRSGTGRISVTGGETTVDERVLAGSHRVSVNMPLPAPEVTIEVSDGLDLCVSSVRYGLAAPEVPR